MADVEHNTQTDPYIHEPKGASTATANTTYVSDGGGSGTWEEPEPKGILTAAAEEVYVADGAASGSLKDTSEIVRMGIYDYNDLGTTSSPISITPIDTAIELTNDGAGANTNLTYKLSDVANPWNTATDRLDFTDLALGDVVDIRLDLTVTTSGANTKITTQTQLGIGGTPYTLPINESNFKSAATHNMVVNTSIYMGNTNTLNNPGRFQILSDTGTATVVVNGWYFKVLKRGLI